MRQKAFWHRLVFGVAAMVCVFSLSLQAARAAEQEARLAVAELMSMLRVVPMTEQSLDQSLELMISAFARANPGKEADIRLILEELVLPEMKRQLPALVAKIGEVYALAFTTEEIRGLIAFYRTPLGQKVVEKLPDIMRASTLLGAEWGKQTATQAIEKHRSAIRQRGIQL